MKLFIEEIVGTTEFQRKLIAKTDIDPAAATLLVDHDDSELWVPVNGTGPGCRRAVIILTHRVMVADDGIAMIVDVATPEVVKLICNQAGISRYAVASDEEDYRDWAIENKVWP